MKNTVALAISLVLLAACGGGTDEDYEDAAPSADAQPQLALSAVPLPEPSPPGASQVRFSGYTFEVRAGNGGPGPNAWSQQNVWVDAAGRLHLKIAYRDGQWSSAEIYTTQALGFGAYQFKIVGHPEAFDRNVVLGLFNYPSNGAGVDGTNEIDIEFATWGGVQPQPGNWTVWPSAAGLPPQTTPFQPKATGLGTYRFNWTQRQVAYQALSGLTDSNRGMYAAWNFAPSNPLQAIPQVPLPLHMNLWLFQGRPPSDGKEVEIVISEFKFTPAKARR